MTLHAHFGEILHYLPDGRPEYFSDGLLLVDEDSGTIIECTAAQSRPDLPDHIRQTRHPNALLMPGFIDSHCHYPQIDIMASYGEQLLDWLNQYTFPAEAEFADAAHARAVAEFFLDELQNAGTTTAMVFATSHPQSADAFFEAARARNMRHICGKVLMDRNAPAALLDSARSGYANSKTLIERWHNQGRLKYAVTPRFAITSTPEQLASAGKLLAEYPGVYLQTHLAENHAEIDFTATLFPERKSYLDVYEHYGLLGATSTFAHGIHLNDAERRRLGDSGSQIAFCPSSNLFLGSGLFNLSASRALCGVSFASDIGAGNSYCMLATLAAAYQVCQLQGYALSAHEAFYSITQGNAQSLRLDAHIGNFNTGKEADFIALDWQATPLLARRTARCRSLEEKLFALMMLGDDRAVKATYIAGKKV
ncbi:guanine deaminase [Uruburuella testudinis]|uniref:Guanine deaminase n=1 Tax=Uruburuella testudinis TaxID=1282863 RepID=A0ABY4DQ87_9NEIS|nr:guanine deaminase [Uruburuella testudinis]UOO81227.1 guanine deaminase [Uruburuella testudinis]